jgi:hypothetical protein
MMLTQSEVGSGRQARGRRLAGEKAKQGSDFLAHTAHVTTMNDVKVGASVDPADCAARGTKPMAVTFWMPDGTCDEGKTRHIGSEVMFIESKRMVPVGTEVTVRLTQPNEAAADWGVAEGTVVWACPAADDFKNLGGFGLSLHGRWPQPPGALGIDSEKGSA